MKSLRKLLVAAIVTAMVLGTVGSAFAAVRTPNMVFSDIEGHPKASYILRTAALGIFDGYPLEDGTFEYRPDQTVSRAEFAAVVVRILGRSDAAEIMKGTPTQFPDVPTTHWANGYINVATALGIIRGYPDGNFVPNGLVTMAESVTMIIRAMGYSPMAEATATWPTGEILTASSMPTIDETNVSILVSGFMSSAACNRANVAEMVYKALPVVFLTGKDADNQWTYSDETLMKKVGGQEISEEVVKYATRDGKMFLVVERPDPEDAEATIDVEIEVASNAILMGAAQFSELHERKVAFIRKGGKVVFAELLPDTQLVRGDFTKYADDKVTVNGQAFGFAATWTLRVNGALLTGGDKTSEMAGWDSNFFKKNPAATLILNDDGDVTVMDVFVYNVEGSIENKVTAYVGTTIERALVVDSEEYWFQNGAEIIRNGEPATFADLKIGDQVKLALGADDEIVAADAMHVTVEGYVTHAGYDMVSGEGMIVLDGDKTVYMPTTGTVPLTRTFYDISGEGLLVSASTTTNISRMEVTNVSLGDWMVVTMDRDGRAFSMTAQERKVTGNVTAKGAGTTPRTITIDGTQYSVATDAEFAYQGTTDMSAADFFAALSVGDFISVALNQAGNIRLAAVTVDMGTVTATDFTASPKRIEVDDIWYTLHADVTVWEGGQEVKLADVSVGDIVRLTFDANNRVTTITLAGAEYSTIVNKRVYIEAGVVVRDIVLDDGRAIRVDQVEAYTLNAKGFTATMDGFNAMAIGDMVRIGYNVEGVAKTIDLFRSMEGVITATGTDVITVNPGLAITGWAGNTAFDVDVDTGTGGTSIMRNGRTAVFGALLPGDNVTVTWAATATADEPVAASLVATWLPLEGEVISKVEQYVGGSLQVVLHIECELERVYEVTVGSNPIVIRDGVSATVADIQVGDAIACNFEETSATNGTSYGTADYFEVESE